MFLPPSCAADLRLDLSTMTGGALPRQECQGAVTRSLKLAVLETQDVSMSSVIN